eukprot:Colp12_sorted_trinity150504_noHs@10032
MESFEDNIKAGLSSELFDVNTNVLDNDQRQGLESNGAEEVKELMLSKNLSFDEARLLLNRKRMLVLRFDVNMHDSFAKIAFLARNMALILTRVFHSTQSL